MYLTYIDVSGYNLPKLCYFSLFFRRIMRWQSEKLLNSNQVLVVTSLDENNVLELLRYLTCPGNKFYCIDLYYCIQEMCKVHGEDMDSVMLFLDFLCVHPSVYANIVRGALDYILGKIVCDNNFKPASEFCLKMITQCVASVDVLSDSQMYMLGLLSSYMDMSCEDLCYPNIVMCNGVAKFGKTKFKRGLVAKFKSIYSTFNRLSLNCNFNCGFKVFCYPRALTGEMVTIGAARSRCCGALAHHHCVLEANGPCPNCCRELSSKPNSVNGLAPVKGTVTQYYATRNAKLSLGVSLYETIPAPINTYCQLLSSINHQSRLTRYYSDRWSESSMLWTDRFEWRNPNGLYTREHFY